MITTNHVFSHSSTKERNTIPALYQTKIFGVPQSWNRMEIIKNGQIVEKTVLENVLSMYSVTIRWPTFSFYVIKSNFSRPQFVGDAYCNDYNNYEDCNFDGGDCCGGSKKYCSECLCKNPSDSDSGNCSKSISYSILIAKILRRWFGLEVKLLTK